MRGTRRERRPDPAYGARLAVERYARLGLELSQQNDTERLQIPLETEPDQPSLWFSEEAFAATHVRGPLA